MQNSAVRAQTWDRGVLTGAEDPHDERAMLARVGRISATAALAEIDRRPRQEPRKTRSVIWTIDNRYYRPSESRALH
jgi:hypothetical protein